MMQRSRMVLMVAVAAISCVVVMLLVTTFSAAPVQPPSAVPEREPRGKQQQAAVREDHGEEGEGQFTPTPGIERAAAGPAYARLSDEADARKAVLAELADADDVSAASESPSSITADSICADGKSSHLARFPPSFSSLVLHMLSFGTTAEWRDVFDVTLFHRAALVQRLRASPSPSSSASSCARNATTTTKVAPAREESSNKTNVNGNDDDDAGAFAREVFPCAGLFDSVRNWSVGEVRRIARKRPRCFANATVAVRTVKFYHSVALGRFAFDADLQREYSGLLRVVSVTANVNDAAAQQQRLLLFPSSASSSRHKQRWRAVQRARQQLDRMVRAASRFVAAHFDAASALLQELIDANIFPVQLRPRAASSAAAQAVFRSSSSGGGGGKVHRLPPPPPGLRYLLRFENPILELMRRTVIHFEEEEEDERTKSPSSGERGADREERCGAHEEVGASHKHSLLRQLRTMSSRRALLYGEYETSSSLRDARCRTRVFRAASIDNHFGWLFRHLRVSAVLRYDTAFHAFQRPAEAKFWNMFRPFLSCSAAPRTCEIPEGCRFVCNSEYLVRTFYQDAAAAAAAASAAVDATTTTTTQKSTDVVVGGRRASVDELDENGGSVPTTTATTTTMHEIVGVGSNNEFDWEDSLLLMYRRFNQSASLSSSSAPASFADAPIFTIFDCTVDALRPSRSLAPLMRAGHFRFLPYCMSSAWQVKMDLRMGELVRRDTFGRAHTDADRTAAHGVKFFPLSGLVGVLRVADGQRVETNESSAASNTTTATAAAAAAVPAGPSSPSPLQAGALEAAPAAVRLSELESDALHVRFLREMQREQPVGTNASGLFFSRFRGDWWKLGESGKQQQQRRSPIRNIDILKVDGESFEFVALPDWTVKAFARIGNRLAAGPAQISKEKRSACTQPGSSGSEATESAESNRRRLRLRRQSAIDLLSCDSALLHSDAHSLGYRIDQFQYELHRQGWTSHAASTVEGLLTTYLLQLHLIAHGFAVYASERNHFGNCCYEVAMAHGRYFVMSEMNS